MISSSPVSCTAFAVDEHGKNQRVDDREGAGLGGREHPHHQAADDDHRHPEGEEGAPARAQHFLEGKGEKGLPAAPPGQIGNDRHLAEAEQDARDQPGQE
jgi:hypothetical protein